MSYYERTIKCDKCRKSERQTTRSLPLDSLAKEMERSFERDFRFKHAYNCHSTVTYSAWVNVR